MILLVPVILLLACASNPHITSLKIYLQQQNWEKALDEGQAWIFEEPGNALAYLWTGVVRINQKDYIEAADNFLTAFELDPSLRDSSTLASNLNISGQPLFTVEGVSVTFQNAGATVAQEDEYENAITYIKEALLLTPAEGKLYTLLSGIYQRLEREEEAREILEMGVEQVDDHAELFYFLALMLGEEEEDQALEHLNRAIEIDEGYAKAYYQRGVIQSRNENLEAATEDFMRAVELDSSLADAYINLGIVAVREENFEEAEKFFLGYKNLKPDDYQGWSLWGVALFNLERYEDALSAFDKSLELYPTNAEAYTYKGLCYKALGMTEESLKAFQKADELGSQP
jgi:tetratricopeptide (TPR) repeat protein